MAGNRNITKTAATQEPAGEAGTGGADPVSRILSRRALLGLFGTAGAAALTGCGGGGGGSSSTGATSTTGSTTTTGTTATTTTTGTATGAVTPEGEIGPYFADDSASGFNRTNVVANLDGTETQTGVPLTLKIYVYDTENGGAALAGAQVDIWHCNALGVYSDIAAEGTTGQNWLRGYQLTDASGLATFTTIVPGWYGGRTTHIHLRVRSHYSEASSTSDGTNTTQVFFPQALLNALYTSVSPYSTKGLDTTTNASDHVYTPETQGETELTLAGDTTNGYTSTFSVRLPITSE